LTQHGVKSEINRLIGWLVLSVVIGLLLGHVLLTIIAGTLLYIGYQLMNMRRLLKWLKHHRLQEVPDANGLWGEIFDLLSRRKRLEIREKKRFKATIARVTATTSALNDAVIVLNTNYGLSWWNEATEALLDLKPRDSGSSIINFIRHPDFVAYLESNKYDIPLTLPSPRNQETQLEFQFTPFGEGEALLVIRDISRIYKLEQMRKDFVANVSHELRTPLTVIRGYLEVLEDNLSKDLQDHHLPKALQQMQQQSLRMTTLIDDLTMLSKLETDAINRTQEYVQLNHLLELVCDEARAISGDKHPIALTCADNIQLLGNNRELHSAFSNLITNAVKYSPEGKTIDITVSDNLAHNLLVEIKDQGIGIEQQHISRLTERFYRVDSSRSIQTGGTGLGLAIVKHILLRHDGRLQIQSTLGLGSTFRCIFPKKRVNDDETLTNGSLARKGPQ
jgi:two-component system phosphate regulon sensor histidine kinase PhoR